MRPSSSYARRVLGALMFAVLIFASLQAQTPPEATGQEVRDQSKSNPRYAEGMGHLRQGQYQQAIESLKQAVETGAGKDAYYYLGLSYYKLGNYQEALGAYQRASELAPQDDYSHHELGKVYWALGNKEAAQHQYQLLKNLDPTLAEYLLDLFSMPLPAAQPANASQQAEASKRSNQSTPPMAEPEQRGGETIYPAGKLGAGKPTILYKERAHYTEIARKNYVQGTVMLSAIFGADGQVTDIKVVRGLPDGLSRMAIESARKIRFQPAVKDGLPVSVRAQLEFNFALY